ncbi:MAG: hypothetical protein R6V60_03515 [Desulfobacterales bacterium]
MEKDFSAIPKKDAKRILDRIKTLEDNLDDGNPKRSRSVRLDKYQIYRPFYAPDRHDDLGYAAIYFSSLPAPLRSGVAILFVLTAIVLLLFLRPRRRGILAFLVIFSVILIGWVSMEPSNDRNWQPDVAVLPYATADGDAVTVHNIRNCDYRTETDFSVHHYDKTFNLSGLCSFDIFLSDWGLRTIVHTLDGTEAAQHHQ